jgi:hypothetical protein
MSYQPVLLFFQKVIFVCVFTVLFFGLNPFVNPGTDESGFIDADFTLFWGYYCCRLFYFKMYDYESLYNVLMV